MIHANWERDSHKGGTFIVMRAFGSVGTMTRSGTGGVKGARIQDMHRYQMSQIALIVAILALAGALYWIVWVYGSVLRDPRYLDGWMLTVGMALQLLFHFATKTARLQPASFKRWRRFHIFTGCFLIAAFLSHSDFTLPDTGFEWILWVSFMAVVVSGVLATYLSWSLSAKHSRDAQVSYDRIPARRMQLAKEVLAAVELGDAGSAAIPLPATPHASWIADLYTNHLRDFFQGPRNGFAHFIGSRRPLMQITHEIDSLSRYVDKENRDKLARIKDLVIEKNKLDFTHVYLRLTRGCMLVHVPATYALVVMTVVHILVAYSFASGDW